MRRCWASGYAPGDLVTFVTPQGEQTVPVAATLSYTPFQPDPDAETLVCSESLFTALTGENSYTIIDV